VTTTAAAILIVIQHCLALAGQLQYPKYLLQLASNE